MKKHIHLGLCCLLSGLMIASSVPIQSTTIELGNTEQDGRTGRILSSVGEVVEGLVKLIKNPHEKPNVLHNVGKMLAGIMNIAANAVQKNMPATQEEMDAMLAMVQNMDLAIDPETQDALMEQALVIHNYLRTVSEEELEMLLHRADESQAADLNDGAAELNTQDHELQTSILSSLHEMIHELFAVIQNPESPQLIGQNIADILANIMNIATQAIKYEYLTSKNAEETVALYIDSFSNELTKKIKNLMLQTALNIRCEQTRGSSCCKTNCGSSCCKSSCSSSSSCCSSNGCKPCCRTMPADDEATRSCSSCGKCSSSCSSCSTGSCCRTMPADDEATRSCSSCGKCSSSCNSCSTGTCCRTMTDEDATRSCSSCGKCSSSCSSCSTGTCCRTMTDEDATRSCSSCGKCSSSCSSCSSCRTMPADDEATRACGCSSSCSTCSTGTYCRTMTDEDATRSCSSCGKCSSSCSSCSSCSTCSSCRTMPADDEATRACGCSSSCSTCSTGTCCRTMTDDADAIRCGCNKPKPTVPTVVGAHNADEETTRACGCSSSCSSCSTGTCCRTMTDDEDAIRCGCNKPKPTQPAIITQVN